MGMMIHVPFPSFSPLLMNLYVSPTGTSFAPPIFPQFRIRHRVCHAMALHLQEILDNRGRGQRTAAPQVGLSWFTIGNPGLLGAIPLEV